MIAVFMGIISVTTNAAEPEIAHSKGQSIYVPIYSHIYSGDHDKPFNLAATLSIRNTDPTYPITVMAVDYFDSDGKHLRNYLDRIIELPPMASTHFVVRESDRSGGVGAGFTVKWKSVQAVNIPLIESVMIGTKMQQGISFTSRGQVIEESSP